MADCKENPDGKNCRSFGLFYSYLINARGDVNIVIHSIKPVTININWRWMRIPFHFY